MVKNTQGGNKHKSQGRKYNNTGNGNSKLRVVEFDGEMYGVVTKMLGNNMFNVYCIDGVVRLGHIRGKFTGRGKKGNIVEPGGWVLIGERPFSNNEKVKIIHCDLLEVYSDDDKEKLKNNVHAQWDILINNDPTKSDKKIVESEGDFQFATDRDIEYQEAMNKLQTGETKELVFNDGEVIDVDDI